MKDHGYTKTLKTNQLNANTRIQPSPVESLNERSTIKNHKQIMKRTDHIKTKEHNNTEPHKQRNKKTDVSSSLGCWILKWPGDKHRNIKHKHENQIQSTKTKEWKNTQTENKTTNNINQTANSILGGWILKWHVNMSKNIKQQTLKQHTINKRKNWKIHKLKTKQRTI